MPRAAGRPADEAPAPPVESGGAPAAQPSGQQAPVPNADDARPTPRGIDGLRVERPPVGAPSKAPLSYPPEHQPLPAEPLYLPLALSVGAGFKFGCGFLLAAGLTGMLLFLVASVIFFVASLAGLPLPFSPI